MKKNTCKKCRLLFDGAFSNELNEEQKVFFDNHLRDCPQCCGEYDGMTAALNFMKKKEQGEPGAVFWEGYRERLEQRMTEENVLPVEQEKKSRFFLPVFESISSFFRGLPTWGLQAAGALAFLLIGIFIGREFFAPAVDTTHQPLPMFASRPGPVPELIHRTQRFVERSRVMLLAIINSDAGSEEAYTLDMPYQQQLSKELVSQAAEIKNGLDIPGQRRLRELVADLEVILLQIANIDSGLDTSAIELIKDGENIRGVLFKIRLLDMRRYSKKEVKTGTNSKKI
ncbi:MAG: zf-HC2 domain-containing protein [Candidatus Aminicenantes bacterium]|nr:zf-HC2 domain-containing protein [Candidatus Aminicenantes bacterium]